MSQTPGSAAPDLTALLRQIGEAVAALSAQHVTPSAPGQTPSTCGVCPVCLGLAALSRNHPQVLGHLGEAMTALAAAAAAFTQPSAATEQASDVASDQSSERAGESGWTARPAGSSGPEETEIPVEE